ncbi:hypothetical protein, partial [Mycobacteroides abscessus]|uniref:hypothetical protein n=1 Tax=Mycobacteroides abscessus TaxID=36809 RepID=UPI0009A75990
MSSLVKAVDPIVPGRSADLRQAQYYQDILGELHSAAQRELDEHLAALERRKQSGKPSNLARLHRLVWLCQPELAPLGRFEVAPVLRARW